MTSVFTRRAPGSKPPRIPTNPRKTSVQFSSAISGAAYEAYWTPNLSGVYGPQYQQALEDFPLGRGLDSDSLRNFNATQKEKFLAGNSAFGVVAYKPVTRAELFRLYASLGDNRWIAEVAQNAEAKFGRKRVYERDANGKRVMQNGVPVLKGMVPRVTRRGLERIHAMGGQSRTRYFTGPQNQTLSLRPPERVFLNGRGEPLEIG